MRLFGHPLGEGVDLLSCVLACKILHELWPVLAIFPHGLIEEQLVLGVPLVNGFPATTGLPVVEKGPQLLDRFLLLRL